MRASTLPSSLCFVFPPPSLSLSTYLPSPPPPLPSRCTTTAATLPTTQSPSSNLPLSPDLHSRSPLMNRAWRYVYVRVFVWACASPPFWLYCTHSVVVCPSPHCTCAPPLTVHVPLPVTVHVPLPLYKYPSPFHCSNWRRCFLRWMRRSFVRCWRPTEATSSSPSTNCSPWARLYRKHCPMNRMC